MLDLPPVDLADDVHVAYLLVSLSAVFSVVKEAKTAARETTYLADLFLTACHERNLSGDLKGHVASRHAGGVKTMKGLSVRISK